MKVLNVMVTEIYLMVVKKVEVMMKVVKEVVMKVCPLMKYVRSLIGIMMEKLVCKTFKIVTV